MPEILVIIASLCILIFLVFYIRGNIVNSKLMEYSKKIELIIKLNKSFDFILLPKSLSISRLYDNKGNFNKIEPGYLMSSEIRNNLEEFSKYISQIKENRENKQIYIKKVQEILSQQIDIDYKELKISRKEYINRERKLLNNLILNPVINLKLCVFMSYSSPKGKVNLSKSDCFTFDDIVASFESVSRTYLDKNTYSKLASVERGEVSDSLRYDVLNRDNFKCVICGASSREGARLHVDHIIPISKGGKSIPSNLRTLCERCNVGKSDKIEDTYIDEPMLENKKVLYCPKCGAELIIRHGKNGDFYGCSNFPKCKHTQNI